MVDACLGRSIIWPMLRKLSLTENMRVREDPQFMEYLMRISNDKEPSEKGHSVILPEHFISEIGDEKPVEHLISEIYHSFEEFNNHPYSSHVQLVCCVVKSEEIISDQGIE